MSSFTPAPRSARDTLIAFGIDPDSVTLPTETPQRRYSEWRLDAETIAAFSEPDYNTTSW